MRSFTYSNLKVLVACVYNNTIFNHAPAKRLSFTFILLTQGNELLSGTECICITDSSMLKPKQIQPYTTHLYFHFN